MKAEIHNYRKFIKTKKCNDPIALAEFKLLLHIAGFTVVNYMQHMFEPQGITMIWLLAESHFAIHTFPEEEQIYIELSSCNKDMFIAFVAYAETWINLYSGKEV
jgi:S-adenosylmethionine decarboxylase